VQFGDSGFDILRGERRGRGLRVRPLRRSYRAPTVMIAAAGILDGALIGFRGRAVALISRLAQAAGVWRSSGHRQR